MDGDKKRPELLDALAFAALDGQALINRLAAIYIKAEPKIKSDLPRKSRDHFEADEKVIAKWMRPIYTPPTGKVRSMVSAVVAEVRRQKDLQVKRGGARAYTVTYSKKQEKTVRRNVCASKLYTLMGVDYSDREPTPKNPCCIAILTIGDHLIAFDGGSYQRSSHIFTLNRRTGRAQIATLEDRFPVESKDLPGILFKMAPPEVRVSLFSGVPVVADFDKLVFLVGHEQEVFPFGIKGDPVITTGFKPPVITIR